MNKVKIILTKANLAVIKLCPQNALAYYINDNFPGNTNPYVVMVKSLVEAFIEIFINEINKKIKNIKILKNIFKN